MKTYLLKFLTWLISGLGFWFLSIPAQIYIFYHLNFFDPSAGSYATKYLWIINGPYPFSHFGSGPFMLFLLASSIIIGLILTFAGMFIRQRFLK